MWLTSTRLMVLGLVMIPAIGWAQPAPIAPAAPPAPPVVVAAPPVVVAPAPVAAPPVVVAPGVEPSECVTTTTVRCTGAAAPYAVQPAPTVVVPPPAVQPAPAPAMPHLLLANPAAVGPGWHLTQTPDGQFWHERTVKGSTPALWGTGLALWISSYLGGVIGGGLTIGSVDMIFNWIPIAGSFINAAIAGDGGRAWWIADGMVQLGGMVSFIVGLAVGPEKIERLPVMVAPTAMAGGGGIAIQGRF